MTPITHGPEIQRAWVIHPVAGGVQRRDQQLRLDEACGLARALDQEVAVASTEPVRSVRPSHFFGSGKVADIAERIKADDISVVVIDDHISPVQQRNLEEDWSVKVIDRTGLILEIFARRARTREGRLQVELARLNYEKSRLVRTWTHLERQRGGFGFFGGPGETQIEADRRLIRDRIARLKRQLEEVKRTRGLHRAARQKVPYPVVALVGYTNAGKSTLFNRLTQADVLAQDMLFATLDPTMRAVRLGPGVEVILSDTVGFITDLPTELIAAFRATLEEVLAADVLVHVRDMAHLESREQAQDVQETLLALGVDIREKPVLEVWNKIDALGTEDQLALRDRAARDDSHPVVLSALSGVGIAHLQAALTLILDRGVQRAILLPVAHGQALAWLHAHGRVVQNTLQGQDHLHLTASLSPAHWGQFEQQFAGQFTQYAEQL